MASHNASRACRSSLFHERSARSITHSHATGSRFRLLTGTAMQALMPSAAAAAGTEVSGERSADVLLLCGGCVSSRNCGGHGSGRPAVPRTSRCSPGVAHASARGARKSRVAMCAVRCSMRCNESCTSFWRTGAFMREQSLSRCLHIASQNGAAWKRFMDGVSAGNGASGRQGDENSKGQRTVVRPTGLKVAAGRRVPCPMMPQGLFCNR